MAEFTEAERVLMAELSAQSLTFVAQIFRAAHAALEDGEISWMETLRLGGIATANIMTLVPAYAESLRGGLDRSDIDAGLLDLAERIRNG